jgi:transposase
MSYVQGIPRDQIVLYPERLAELIPADDPARLVEAFCRAVPYRQLGFTHAVSARTGRPAYDPSHMLSLLLWGFMNGLTSSRKLEEATKKNVSVMWLIERVQPDFKTISEFRRANVAAIPLLMRQCTTWMREQELLGGELVAIDGSKFRASNGRDRNYTEKTVAAKQARIDGKIKAYLEQLEREDAEDEKSEQPPALTADQIREAIARLNERKDFYEGIVEQMQKMGASQISLTDPDSRSMKTNDGINVCYNAQIAVDSKNALIVAESVTNQVNDEQQLYAMAAAAKEALAVDTLAVVADTGYVNSTELAKCEADGITAYVPPLTMPKRDGKFPKDAFRYDAATDSYTCPAGEVLTHVAQGMNRNRLVHYYRTTQCGDCPLRPQCTSSSEGRRVARRDDEPTREAAAERARLRPDIMRARQQLVEHPFGTIKRQINRGYFQLRGLGKVAAEFTLAVLAFNFKRILTLCPLAT